MFKLETLYSSNIPIDCHILKGRLETEGISCVLWDENMVWIHPFRAAAIGGVKLKVSSDQLQNGIDQIEQLNQGKLLDELGAYRIEEIFQWEFEKQMEVLNIKTEIRKNPALIDQAHEMDSTKLNRDEIDKIIDAEKDFQQWSNKKLNFTWKNFFYELFDFDRCVFSYLRVRPVDYYMDKDIIDKFNSTILSNHSDSCPNCNSDNVKYGYAIDYKWDVIYLILSILFAPFPLFRKKIHCFDCGADFKEKGKDKKNDCNEIAGPGSLIE